MAITVTEDNLRSQLWRICNLYSCRVEGLGRPVRFKPRPEQLMILKHLIERPSVPIYIIKSRRLGMSTLVDTFMTDSAVFGQGFRGIIIDRKQDEATKKMVEIVRFAFDNMDKMFRERFEPDAKRNDSEMRWRLLGEDESKDSAVYATTGSRGGDCSMLHVSEWGPIAAEDPLRSKEIRTGALPSARRGRRVVETTWSGGKGGDLWQLVKPIMERDPNAEGVVYFFPWWSDPLAVKVDGLVTGEAEEYFKDLTAKTSRSFTADQKKWYIGKRLEQGIFVKREYPSTLEEAFSAPVEGSIYGDAVSAIRGLGQICPFQYDRDWPVFCCWDVGWEDMTVVWFVQQVGLNFHWIHHLRAQHHTAAQMALLIGQTGIGVTGHIIPHDAAAKKPGDGKNYMDSMRDAGLTNLIKVPQCRSVWPGINRLRAIIARSYFRMPQCGPGVDALEAYHTKMTASGGTIVKDPHHDWSSHDADAARYYAEAEQLGLINTTAAKRMLNVTPRYPDGSIVDVDTVIEQRERHQTAISGHTEL